MILQTVIRYRGIETSGPYKNIDIKNENLNLKIIFYIKLYENLISPFPIIFLDLL